MPPPPPPGVSQFAATDPVSGIPAFGTLIQVLSSAGPPEVFVTIAGVGDITGPANTIAEVDVTSHSSGAPIKQTLPGLIDLGDIAFPCYWNPSDPTQNVSSSYGLEYLFFNRIVTKFRLVIPDPTHRAREFYGFVKSIGEDYKVAGVCTRNVAIRITSVMSDVASPINVTPSSLSTPAAALPTSTFNVAAGGSLAPWTAVPDVSWITVTTPSGPQTGDGDVTFSVAANVTAPVTPRVGHINISGLGLVFTVDQSDT
jgi:hypothetical protein